MVLVHDNHFSISAHRNSRARPSSDPSLITSVVVVIVAEPEHRRLTTEKVNKRFENVLKTVLKTCSNRFEINLAHPSWIVNVWVTNMVTLFRPQIRELIYQRDIVVHRRKEAFPDRNVFEDREFEVVTECDIDLDAQMSAIEAVLSAR